MASDPSPTNQDLLDALQAMETRLDGRIDSVNRRLTGIENRLTSVEQLLIKIAAALPVSVG